jgi:hypothetical protein
MKRPVVLIIEKMLRAKSRIYVRIKYSSQALPISNGLDDGEFGNLLLEFD